MKLGYGDVMLRPFELLDGEELFSLTNKNRAYLRQWLPWVDGTRTVDDSRGFIQSVTEKDPVVQFGIWYQDRLVGAIGYHELSNRNRRASMGYWVAEDSQGKGIVTSACKLLIAYGFTTLDLHRIEILCAVDNAKSCAVPERLGFTFEGILRQAEWLYDHFVDLRIYSLLQDEWKI